MGAAEGKSSGGVLCSSCSACSSSNRAAMVSDVRTDLPDHVSTIDAEAEINVDSFMDPPGAVKAVLLRTVVFPALPVGPLGELQQEAVHRAAARGVPAEVQDLLKRVAAEHRQILLEHPDEEGRGALHVAARAGHFEVIHTLAALASDVAALQLQADRAGQLPVHAAADAYTGQADVLRALVRHPPGKQLLELWDAEGQAPIHIAARKGRVSALTAIAEMAPEAFLFKTSLGHTALHTAIEGSQVEVVIALIRLSLEIPVTHREGSNRQDPRALIEMKDGLASPLHSAARYGSLQTCSVKHIQMTSELLKAKANTEEPYTVEGETLLTTAARLGHDIVVDVLMARGDVRHETRSGNTAMHYACLNGHSKTVDALLEARACIKHHDEVGRTPLMRAASRGHSAIATQLLQSDAEVNHAGGAGNTALLCAAREGHAFTVRSLLQAGAAVKHVNMYGNTALILACTAGSKDTVKALLDAKADATHTDTAGITALEEASYKGHAEILKMLEYAIDPTKMQQVVEKSKEHAAKATRGLRLKTKPASAPPSPR